MAEDNNDDVEKTRARALELLRQGKGADALDCVGRSLELRSQDPRLWELRGVVLTRLGMHLDAVESYDRAREVGPDGTLLPYILNNQGISLFALKLWDKARDAFSEAAKRSWKYEAQAHNNLGLALMKLGDLCGAVEEFRKATQPKAGLAETGFPEAFNNLGQAFEKLGDESKALASYDQALKLRDCFPEAHANRGRIFEGRKEFERALGDYEAAAAQSPNSSYYESDCVRMLHALGYPEAKRRLRALLARDPVFEQVAYLLGKEPSTWWEWWFCSMCQHPWRFGLGAFLLALLALSLVLPLLRIDADLPVQIGGPWHQYALTAVGSFLFLFWPHIRRIGREGVEFGRPVTRGDGQASQPTEETTRDDR